MFIIEILLTIFAWRKGWRWFSLIPVGIAFLIGLMFGFSQIEPGATAIFIDILAMIALILMIVYPKKEKTPPLKFPVFQVEFTILPLLKVPPDQ